MKISIEDLLKNGHTRRGRYVISWPREEAEDGKSVDFYLMPKDVYDHKDYPTCIQCGNKYVPINKGEMLCFSCSFTRK